MNDSWSIIRKVLGWANVVLEEVQAVMASSDGQHDVARNDVAEAQHSVKRLLDYEQQALFEASATLQYQELVKKLQAEEMPITPEQWRRAQRLDGE